MYILPYSPSCILHIYLVLNILVNKELLKGFLFDQNSCYLYPGVLGFTILLIVYFTSVKNYKVKPSN